MHGTAIMWDECMWTCGPPFYERQAEWNRVASSNLTESSPSRAAAQFGDGDPNELDVRVSKNESGLGDNAPGICGTPSRPVWTKLLNWPVGSAAHRLARSRAAALENCWDKGVSCPPMNWTVPLTPS